MNSKMNIDNGTPLLIAIGVLATLVCGMTCECDSCQPKNSIACHSENVFSLCVNGVATHDHVHCPDQKVCTDSLHVCVSRHDAISNCSRKDVAPPGCGVCNIPGRLFACVSETTIAFCFGNHAPDTKAIAQCPQGTVCDLSNVHEFCTPRSQVSPSCALHATEISTTTTTEAVPATTTTRAVPTTTTTAVPTTTKTTAAVPTTTTTAAVPTKTTAAVVPTTTTTTAVPTTTTTTTAVPTTTTTTTTAVPTTTTAAVQTTTAPFDPLTYCESGKLIFADENDANCRKYFLCYKLNTAWEPLIKTCPNPKPYFNPDSNLCEATKPARCL